MQVLPMGCEPPVWGKGWSWRLKIGSMNSTVLTSYFTRCISIITAVRFVIVDFKEMNEERLIVTIGPFVTVFAVLRLVTGRQSEGQTDWSSKRRQFYRPPNGKTLR